MKRIQAACLFQTIRFQQKDPMDKDSTARANYTEFERYKVQLQRSYTKFAIVSENVLEDGTLEVQLKKQYNSYHTGSYLD